MKSTKRKVRNSEHKSEIREKYRGVDPSEIEVIPANEDSDLDIENRKMKVAAYVRVSTQNDEQTSSIELQVNDFTKRMGDMRSIYSNSSGLFWQGRFYVIVEAILNIVLNYFLGKRFGVHGIIAATNLTILFINFIWGSLILYKYYFVNMDVKRYFLLELSRNVQSKNTQNLG